MGLFSGSSKTYVSTVTYPLSSDNPDDRVEFHKYVLLNAVMQEKSIGESLTKSLLHGRGMQLRSAYSYARDHYTYGLPYSGSLFIANPSQNEIRDVLGPANSPSDVFVLTSTVSLTDFTYWGEAFLAERYGYNRLMGLFLAPPEGVEQDATISYDISLGGVIEILLVNANGDTTLLTHKPEQMISQEMYLHSIYRLIDTYPTKSSTLVREKIEGEVDTVSTTQVIIDLAGQTQEKTTVVTTTVAEDSTSVESSETVRVLSRPQYLLYRLGTGTYPAFDAWLNSEVIASPYMPSIPLRVDNVDVSTTEAAKRTDLYKTSKKLLHKVGAELDELATKINENEQVSEIDFAYVQFGVALNTRTPECKQYIYLFLEQMMGLSFNTRASTEAWVTEYNITRQFMKDLGLVNESGSGAGGGGIVPITGDGENRGFTTPPLNRLQIYDRLNRAKKSTLDVELQWQYIEKTVKPGVVEEGAKPGTCTVAMEGEKQQYNVMYDFTVDNSTLLVCRQLTENTYEELRVGGLVFFNHVYKNKSVAISAWDALNVADEEGFIFPLSQDILRQMPLIKMTQLSSDCLHMVLNSYKVVKKKWYQTGFFAILMIIVAIILLVVSWGSSAPASGSMIASALTALANIGIVGTLALIIVATVTVLVGMIISNLLTPVLSSVFGETWGPIIAAVVAMIAMNWAAGGNIAASMSQLTQVTAANVIRASSAVLEAYGRYASNKALGIGEEIQALQSEERMRMEEIEKLTRENLGTNTDLIDIQGLIDSAAINMETSASFLTRTLMTGSDVVAVTQGLIDNFVEVGLYLPTNA